MKALLERAIVHLLNGDEDKAAALFHKFMVERARQIHESLRQDGSSDELEENWDSEIKEEEYFGDEDLGNEPEDTAGDFGGDGTDVEAVGDDVGGEFGGEDEFGGEEPVDDVEDDLTDVDDTLDAETGEEAGLEDKIDDLTGKIDELTAEFDRVMAEFHDDDFESGEGEVDDVEGGDEFAPTDVEGGDEIEGDDVDTTEDSADLANRMDDDMADTDVDEPVHESEDDDLTDITESVLAELDKIAAPGNTEHKGVGQSGVKNTITNANGTSPIPHHNVMDRMKGEPVMTKGPTHKGYAREASPTVAGADNLVKNVRPGNRRKTSTDTTHTVDAKGDASALLHKDFAPGMPKATKSIIDGKSSK